MREHYSKDELMTIGNSDKCCAHKLNNLKEDIAYYAETGDRLAKCCCCVIRIRLNSKGRLLIVKDYGHPSIVCVHCARHCYQELTYTCLFERRIKLIHGNETCEEFHRRT